MVDPYARVAINNVDMTVSNFGSIANRFDGSAGLEFPRGSGNTAVFAGGLWFSAKRMGVLTEAVAEYGSSFRPGTIQSDGTPSPDDSRFRSYTLLRGDTTSADYVAWPSQDGAPLDAQGRPSVLGDMMVWSVYNGATANPPLVNTPAGIEVRQSAFAYSASDDNTVFVQFQIHNRTGATLDSAFVGIWLDPDLGDFSDDKSGCDTTVSLGYCYNASPIDAVYGSSPPAVGIVMLQGPEFLPMTAFWSSLNGSDPVDPTERALVLRGQQRDGSAMHVQDDPNGPVTTFRYSGDPVSGTGWIDGQGGDQRLLVSAGPFSMADGDSQTVVAAVVMGQGRDRLSSLTDLRFRVGSAIVTYQASFPAPGSSPPAFLVAPPSVTGISGQPVVFGLNILGGGGTAWSWNSPDLPAGAELTATGDRTATFRWIPADLDVGAHRVTVQAWAPGRDTVRAQTGLRITRSPGLDTLYSMVAIAGSVVDQPVRATDPDGDFISLTLTAAPPMAFLTLNEVTYQPGMTTGRVVLAPQGSEYGNFDNVTGTATLTASDGIAHAERSFHVEVHAYPPYPPHLNADPTVEVVTGSFIKIRAELNDSNQEDSLRIDVQGNPSSLTLHVHPEYQGMGATLEGVLEEGEAGTYQIVWTGSDGVYPAVSDTTVLRVLPRPTAPDPPLFSSPYIGYSLLPDPRCLVMGDFDGDGRTDAALGSGSPGVLSLRVADPSEGFFPSLDAPLPGRPIAMAAGDWNQDGKLDLAVLCDSLPGLWILSGDGHGAFQTVKVSLQLTLPTAISAGNLDGNGTRDLVISDPGAHRLHFLSGVGDGSFVPGPDVETIWNPSRVTLADLDNDGRMDLVYASRESNRFGTVFGPLLTSPRAGPTYPTVNSPVQVLVGNVAGSGRDVVVVGSGSFARGILQIWQGHGDGTLTNPTSILLQGMPADARLADVNGDGTQDVLVLHNGDVSIARGEEIEGPGIWTFPGENGSLGTPIETELRGGLSRALDVADLDFDGKEDAVVVQTAPPLLIAVLGPVSQGARPARFRPPLGFRSPTVGDYDGDGDVDLAGSLGSGIVWWANEGNGKLAPGSSVLLLPGSPRLSDGVKSGDFNGDGKEDLLTLVGDSLYEFLGGSTGFAAPIIVRVRDHLDSLVTSYSPLRLEAHDLDGDGADEAVLLFAGFAGSSVCGVLIGNGGPAPLQGWVTRTVANDFGSFNLGLALDAGRIDLVVEDLTGPRIYSWDEAGTNFSVTGTADQVYSGTATAVDVDGDGRKDLLFLGYSGVVWLRGRADGGWDTPQSLPPLTSFGSVVSGDFNEDGREDIAVVMGQIVTAALGGGASFDAAGFRVGLGVPGAVYNLLVADMNGDGAPDLVTYSKGESSEEAPFVTTLWNQTVAAPVASLVSASATDGIVRIAWQTALDPGTRGHVFRTAAGDTTRVDSVSVGDQGQVFFADSKARPGATYSYRLELRRGGVMTSAALVTVSVPIPPSPAPLSFRLWPVGPNPIRTSATIRWSLPSAQAIRLRVFDARGRLVVSLREGASIAGTTQLEWSGSGRDGRPLASGVYWISLESPLGDRTRKMVILR